jgi:hypothetical protein
LHGALTAAFAVALAFGVLRSRHSVLRRHVDVARREHAEQALRG